MYIYTLHQGNKKIVLPTKNYLLQLIGRTNPGSNVAKVEEAFYFTYNIYEKDVTDSKQPYIIHSLSVAEILAEQKFDTISIIAALLYNTKASYKDVLSNFGSKVANLVSTLKSLAKIEESIDIQQAEDLCKLLFAMSPDIRVVLVKLAERIYNMRTLQHISDQEKCIKIAQKTLDIYSPMAERIGIEQFKNELEDLSFGVLQPKAKEIILSKLKTLHTSKIKYIEEVKSTINSALIKHNITAEISGRTKTPYSIWRKMEEQNLNFEQLSDIIALRILVNNNQDCYRALEVLHLIYKEVPGTYKDYISNPKNNGYMSLHTLINEANNRFIEVQIRTFSMHDIAEFGLAAHWAYKHGITENISKESSHFNWIHEMLEILQNSIYTEGLLENDDFIMYDQQVFCFTPQGDVIELPQGSTAMDFAAKNHKKGFSCIGSKINNKYAFLNQKLKNGDKVEIISCRTQSIYLRFFLILTKIITTIMMFISLIKKVKFTNLYIFISQNIFHQRIGKYLRNYAVQTTNKLNLLQLLRILTSLIIKYKNKLLSLFYNLITYFKNKH